MNPLSFLYTPSMNDKYEKKWLLVAGRPFLFAGWLHVYKYEYKYTGFSVLSYDKLFIYP